MRRRLALLALSLAAFTDGLGKPFSPPTPEERLQAIGDLSTLDSALWPAFLALEDFDPIPTPGENDWLAIHSEPGQSFQDFLADDMPRPDADQRVLYLQPIGRMDRTHIDVTQLADYCHLFFNTKVQLLPDFELDPNEARRRVNEFTGEKQLHAADILEFLQKRRPDDAFAVIAFTLTDLYPSDSWNFVFGLADYRRGVGVFSFARYGDPQTQAALFNERALKVMSHEIGHMYGIKHCVYFRCLMNGSNGLFETDSAPLNLCPVCLRKLHHSAQPDLLERYARLGAFYEQGDMPAAAAFTRKRVRRNLEHGF
jgi:archaemetzincin